MRYSLFGESHGERIGVVIEGVKPGLTVDVDFIKSEMKRRAPGTSSVSTSRKEADEVKVVSGVFQGLTTGAPLCGLIENTDTRSADYDRLKNIPRPGHSDYAAYVKYRGFNDHRGGGHFSGRLTAPLVFAGAIAKLHLKSKGISVWGRVKEIGGIRDNSEDFPEEGLYGHVDIAASSEELRGKMRQAIEAAKAEGDALGGIIECRIDGLSAGLGEPGLNSLEGMLARHVFAVPAVKGIEFGAGFGFAGLRASEANDGFYVEGGQVKTRSNNSGGINGGISNGMPIVFRAVFRPTPSIAKSQNSIRLDTMENTELQIAGRHDPCIVPRAVVVLEAAAALALCEVFGGAYD